ncbi:hypothetical protein SAMN05661044_01152 [Olivibacter domesticus]|uniref:Uncharacterized protein n=1 Tax=Olivibacter domesticus TaxID=407022 RepID=A0A1H7JWP7_OLID1|nr:hypothetical protein SAMN05661044_01152 [Olivibacter domesticus]
MATKVLILVASGQLQNTLIVAFNLANKNLCFLSLQKVQFNEISERDFYRTDYP